jgi:hypothetical protein
MVVMEGGCSGVETPSSGSQSVPHRAWYDGSGSSQQDIDAYFKGSTNYFSQMQGAYSGMSYHGATIVFNLSFLIENRISYVNNGK